MFENSTINITEHRVFEQHILLATRLPDELDHYAAAHFTKLWGMHPAAFHEITQPFTGKRIPLPRWQQAYGHDYHYTGTTNRALPVDDILEPFLVWTQQKFDDRLNGLLLNWYDAAQRHYIGAHSDSIVDLITETPIVTISLGSTRTFRLRPKRGTGFTDFEAGHGTVFILPWDTNLHIKHEVPHRKHSDGQRISITMRAFVA